MECEVVHSSINAVAVYERLGFTVTDGVREENGIRYVPMAYKRTSKEDCPCKRTDCARHAYCAEGRANHARKNASSRARGEMLKKEKPCLIVRTRLSSYCGKVKIIR